MNIAVNNIEVHLPAGGGRLFQISKFAAERGSHILIEGESGKGKTTFLHLLAGLFPPVKGRVEIGDHRLHEMSDEERCRFRRANIGIIFQKLNLIEHLTPFENVLLLVGSGNEARARAEQTLRAVGLETQMNRRSSVLSLGEQQRVAVARVLAADSNIILADEPTSSLDEKNAARVMDLLLSAASDKTLIVVSHDHRIEKKFSKVIQFADMVK